MAGINELLNIDLHDIMKMNRNELAKTVSQLSSAANKRINRLRKAEKEIGESPELRVFNKSGSKKFGTKGKNLAQLRNEYTRVKNFLNAKTSTVKGFKKYKKQIFERIGGELTNEQLKEFWEIYEKMKEKNPLIFRIIGSDQIQQSLRDIEKTNTSLSSDERLQKAFDLLEDEYRNYMSKEIEFEKALYEELENEFFDYGEWDDI